GICPAAGADGTDRPEGVPELHGRGPQAGRSARRCGRQAGRVTLDAPMDTIFALSSGSPPAGIAVIRVSGPAAGDALLALAGRLPPPRLARRAALHNAAGDMLDDGLVLWFPGPGTATGEDLAEFHLHGGRAVVAVVEA